MAVTACGRAEDGERIFNSKVAFSVFIQKAPHGDGEFLGRTPSDKPLTIPAGASWWVIPFGPQDMAKVRAAVRAHGIPGLELTDASDADLAGLKGLTTLRMLGLTFCRQITDDGLAHLKGLTNLQTLRLPSANITDNGLVHLNGLTKLRNCEPSTSGIRRSPTPA